MSLRNVIKEALEGCDELMLDVACPGHDSDIIARAVEDRVKSYLDSVGEYCCADSL